MINKNDFILKENKHGEKRYFYRATCNDCGADRGYKRNSVLNANALCRSCSQKGVNDIENYPNVNFDDFIINTKSKSYKTTCIECFKDKGYIRKKDALKPCLSCAAKIRHNMMCPLIRDKAKVKISCTQRNIEVKDFKDFTTPENEKERNKFKSSTARDTCFQNADYTCDLFGIKGRELNAHHLESWDKNEEGRFELDNLVCLSEPAHKAFHKVYGKGNNTKDQYEEFKKEVEVYKATKQDLLLVAGCPASGKSWVCNQLKDKFNYVSYDEVNRNLHVYELLKNNSKQLLFDPTIKISTFTKDIGHLFNIRLIVIKEDESIINNRMISRGGEVTETIKKRIKRMNDLSKKCEFSGTSLEVFNYLKGI